MEPLRKRLLLVGWGGADWKMVNPLLEKGQMPNLARLIESGVAGNVTSPAPMLSPILWTSIATGKHADKHGILGFVEPDTTSGTTSGTTSAATNGATRGTTGGDGTMNGAAAGRIRPVGSTSRRCKAIWNILSDCDVAPLTRMRSCVVNSCASHPAETIHGVVVTDRFAQAVGPPHHKWPAVQGSVHPAELLTEACMQRVHPAAITPRQLARFVPKLSRLGPQGDAKPPVGSLADELAIVMAECATTHALTTWLMEDQDWNLMAVRYDVIDRFARAFLVSHRPNMDRLGGKEFEHYRDAITECCRLCDTMLGRLMALAEADTRIIFLSDGGFPANRLRAAGRAKIKDRRPAARHRQYGMLVIAGPNIKKAQRVCGASLLDVTPTMLWLLGRPVAKDMDGKPLTRIRDGEDELEVLEIETYEGMSHVGPTSARQRPPVGLVPLCPCPGMSEAGSANPQSEIQGQVPLVGPRSEEDLSVTQRVLERLAELGYVEQDESVEDVLLNRVWNLGQVYAATGRPQAAIEQYEEVLAKKPDDKGCKMAIASCRLEMGDLDGCEQAVKEVLPDQADAPHANLYMGIISFRRGDTDAALNYLKEAEKADPRMPGLHCQIGNVCLRRQRWVDAERAFETALEIDPDSAEAHDGLGVAYRWQKRPEQAVREHMQSIALLHHRPQTHIHLGLALADAGQIGRAIQSFNVAIEQDPNDPVPHRCLAQLYEQAKRAPVKAAWHRKKADELRAAMGNAGSDAVGPASSNSQD